MSKFICMVAAALSLALAGCAGTMPVDQIEKGMIGTSSAGSPS